MLALYRPPCVYAELLLLTSQSTLLLGDQPLEVSASVDALLAELVVLHVGEVLLTLLRREGR